MHIKSNQETLTFSHDRLTNTKYLRIIHNEKTQKWLLLNNRQQPVQNCDLWERANKWDKSYDHIHFLHGGTASTIKQSGEAETEKSLGKLRQLNLRDRAPKRKKQNKKDRKHRNLHRYPLEPLAEYEAMRIKHLIPQYKANNNYHGAVHNSQCS